MGCGVIGTNGHWPQCSLARISRVATHKDLPGPLGNQSRFRQGFGVRNPKLRRARFLPALVHASCNPVGYADPTGLKCNASGCWLAPNEKSLADSGDDMGYYGAACTAGDSYACAARDVAGNVGLAANFTNWRLRRSLLENGTPENQCDAKMEGIRKDLAQAHASALSGGLPDRPLVLTAGQISQFHHNVFAREGAGSVFGGDIPGSNLIFNWCSLPSCRP